MIKQGTTKTTNIWPVRFPKKVQWLVERAMKKVAGRNWRTKRGLRTKIVLQAIEVGLQKYRSKKRDLP